MLDDFSKCGECGKFFVPMGQADYCRLCAAHRAEDLEELARAMDQLGADAANPQALATSAGLSEDRVKALMQDSNTLARDLDADKVCTRCERRQAQYGSEFCLECRMTLFKRLGEAADEMFDKVDTLRSRISGLVSSRPSSGGVVAAMRDKRKLTPNIRTNPKGRWKS